MTLTYTFSRNERLPLYEQLYRFIRDDVISGRIAPGEKLPSKRTLAENLEISLITVENAYLQLCAEGYIRSEPRRGYFAENVAGIKNVREYSGGRESSARRGDPAGRSDPNGYGDPPESQKTDGVDIACNRIESSLFPFSVWSRLMRETLLDYDSGLLDPLPSTGAKRLRQAVADHLRDFRAMDVSPEQIVIGAGAEYLYMLAAMLFGKNRTYAVENPGYHKTERIYTSMGAKCVAVGVDRDGAIIPEVYGSGADVLHISPAHHFPTGIVTSAGRRGELLEWAKGGRYIIEDDYDSEFRFSPKPIPPMQTSDSDGRVVFVNTFSKTISPSLRIGYMVLPEELCEKLKRELEFLSCTVAAAEQYTLASFIERGYFEKHINRMRRFYKGRRDRILGMIQSSPLWDKAVISEENAGLHFLLQIDAGISGEKLRRVCAAAGIRAALLSDYYRDAVPEKAERTLVVNYSGTNEDAFGRALDVLSDAL